MRGIYEMNEMVMIIWDFEESKKFQKFRPYFHNMTLEVESIIVIASFYP